MKNKGSVRLLKFVEYMGNLLPHPVILFIYFCGIVIVFSAILEAFGLKVLDPRPDAAPNAIIHAKNLMTIESLQSFLPSIISNFVNFAPLGTVLVTMLGVGIAEQSGLLSAAIRAVVLRAPMRFVSYFIVFAGVVSNIASVMGYVVLIPLAAYMFRAMGRHPLAGLAAGFAGVSGGYSANIMIGSVDPLLSGISQEAARLVIQEYNVHPVSNWYFMFASTFLVTIVGGFVTDKIVEPNLGPYNPDMDDNRELKRKQDLLLDDLEKREKKALLWAFVTLLATFSIYFLSVYPDNGFLRKGPDVFTSPFMESIIPLIVVAFILPSLVYGYIVGSINKQTDIVYGMEQAISKLGLYIVIVFFAAQFIALFNASQLGLIIAVKGSEFLRSLQLTSPLVFFPFIAMCAFINLMLGSASAQWAATAPIFIPMLMLLGYSPETIQAAYRIGDSTTNIITPMMTYFGLILAYANQFQKGIGLGTIVATMLPYSIALFLVWSLFFYLWVFILGFPVGPGATTYLAL